MVYVFYKG